MDIKKLIKSTVSAPDYTQRIQEISNKLPEGSAIVDLFIELDSRAIVSPSNALVFFTIINISEFQDKMIKLTLKQLLRLTERKNPELVALWKLVQSLEGEERVCFLSRAALLLEVICMAWQDVNESGKTVNSIPGSSLLLKIYDKDDLTSQELSLEASSFPPKLWKKMEGILEELDFAKEKKIWTYRIDIDSRARLISATNLKAYIKTGAETLSPLALARLSQNLVTRFSLLIKTISMYPSDHPSIAPSLASFIELLESFMGKEVGMVALTILGGELMVNNVRVKTKTKSTKNFLSHLTERRINSISFKQGLTKENLFSFIDLLNRKPSQIRSRGGLNDMCRTRAVENVSVDEFRYALVAKDGKLVSEVVTGTVDVALEDIIFRELIDRLRKGDSIKDIPSEKLGEAFTHILEEASSGTGKYRSMLADFVATLDPTILEKGILVSRDLQKTLAWSSLRKIIDKNLEDLESEHLDVVLESIDKLTQLASIGAERGKVHTVMHVTDRVFSFLKEDKFTADSIFAAIILLGAICERLITTGRLASAAELATKITDCRLLPVDSPAKTSALRRGLSEAYRRIDTPDAADVIISAFLDADERRYQSAETIAGEILFRNLGMSLVELFLERDRTVRARVYSILRRFGRGYLLMFHIRIEEIVRGDISSRDPETKRFVINDWYIIRNLIALLGDLGSEKSIPVLAKLCTDDDDRVRKLALLSLMKISEKEAIILASNMIDDSSHEVVTVAIEVLAKSSYVDAGFIPVFLRLMYSLPAARKPLIRYLLKVCTDEQVRQHFRVLFQNTKGIPFDDENLMQDALILMIRAGGIEEIEALKSYIDNNSSGKFRKASAPENVLVTVSSAIDVIRTSSRVF